VWEFQESVALPAIEHNNLNKLQSPHLIEFYNNLSEEGLRQDQKYKPKYNYIELLEEHNLINFIAKYNESIMNDENITEEAKKNYLLDKISLHG
jgi:hypothetical protein